MQLPDSVQPTWHGHINTPEDAKLILEACLLGNLNHAARGPYRYEIPNLEWQGKILVVEKSASGISQWKDHAEWETLEPDGPFSIHSLKCGLRKRIVTMSWQGIQHILIAYYGEDQAPLKTPSKSTEFLDLTVRGGLGILSST